MQLDSTFAALADPTRRALLAQLESGERTLSELAAPLPMSLMAVQKHVKTLEDAGLVETRKVGRSRYVKLRPEGLSPVGDWVRRSEARWNAAFDRLAQALEEDEE
ncbi:MAG TPA: metalloregulator ArsR/SmtB family transcription factor [Candidatus Thermoplasmatota archaeon]|nr:metalloregulator ArsR/SmtB family transcription factor [Candidatus Thermoplasmatota archaeon]